MARRIRRTLWLGRTDGALHRLVLFVWRGLHASHWIRLPVQRNPGLAVTPLRSQKRGVSDVWRRSLRDHRAFLSHVVAAAGSLLCGLAIAKTPTQKSAASQVLAACSSAASVCHLLFQRPDEMSGQRLVGWFECVARSYPAAVQHC